MIIYCIRNKINNKCYVGKYVGCNSNEEFQKSNYWGSGTYIQNSIKKYGLENFKKWVLIHCDKKEGCFYEILWIKKLKTKYPNGYNLTDGGDGSIGCKWSEESRKKVKGRKQNRTDEWNKKIGLGNKGKKRSQNTKNLLSNLKKGIKQTKESNIKRSQKLKGRIFSQETIQKILLTKSINHKIPQYKKICIKCNKHFIGTGSASTMCNECKQQIYIETHSENYKKLKKEQHTINCIIAANNRVCVKICKKCGEIFQCKSGATLFCDNCKKISTFNKLLPKYIPFEHDATNVPQLLGYGRIK